MVVHTYDPSDQEDDARGSCVQGQPGVHSACQKKSPQVHASFIFWLFSTFQQLHLISRLQSQMFVHNYTTQVLFCCCSNQLIIFFFFAKTAKVSLLYGCHCSLQSQLLSGRPSSTRETEINRTMKAQVNNSSVHAWVCVHACECMNRCQERFYFL